MPFKCLTEETQKLSSQMQIIITNKPALALKENWHKHGSHLCWWCSARGSRWGRCHTDRHSTRSPVCTPTDQSGPQTPRTTEWYKQQFQSIALFWLCKKGQCYPPSIIITIMYSFMGYFSRLEHIAHYKQRTKRWSKQTFMNTHTHTQ